MGALRASGAARASAARSSSRADAARAPRRRGDIQGREEPEAVARNVARRIGFLERERGGEDADRRLEENWDEGFEGEGEGFDFGSSGSAAGRFSLSRIVSASCRPLRLLAPLGFLGVPGLSRPGSDAPTAVAAPIASLSPSNRRLLALASAGVGLDGSRGVAAVDQPTAGVDSERRAHVWAALAARTERGGAAIVATDALDEAEAIATKIVVMRGGRVVAADAPAALKARCATSYRLEATLGKEATTEDAIEALDALVASAAPTLEERGATGTGEGGDRDPRDPLRPPTETFDSRTSDHFARVAARSRRRRRGGSSALSALGAAGNGGTTWGRCGSAPWRGSARRSTPPSPTKRSRGTRSPGRRSRGPS